MHLVRVGKRVVNLEYLILSEEWDGGPETVQLAPGRVRVTLESGRVLVLDETDSAEWLRSLESELTPCPDLPAFARPYDPATGDPTPPESVRDTIESG